MALDFTLLSGEQIWGYENGNGQLEVMKRYGTKVAPTDLTYLLGSNKSRKFMNTYTSEGDPTCDSWSSTPSSGYGEVISVGLRGSPISQENFKRTISVRPALSPSEASKISPSEKKRPDKKRSFLGVLEYGEYPQTVANKYISEKLEGLYESKSLHSTGKSYTFDSPYLLYQDAPFKATNYSEYELDGKKYIRISHPHGHGVSVSPGDAESPCWIQVEPIEWLIDKSGWMIAKKCLFSGIPFDIKESYSGDFSQTFMKHYLNTYFAKEIEPSKTTSKKRLIALLSEQDRKEIEDDGSVTFFREARKAVIEQALEQTEKLKGKEKRKAELATLRKVNVQSLRDAEGRARAKKMASILKKKQSTK